MNKTARSDTANVPNKAAKDDDSSEKAFHSEIWLLEDVYPETAGILSPSGPVTAISPDVLVVVDTNVLLLPLKMAKQELSEIEKAYQRLESEDRLYIPARVVREYVKNRDGRLATIEKSLLDKSSSSAGGAVDIPPLLAGLPETNAVVAAAQALTEARKAYLASISSLVELIRGWRGNDPVTAIYNRILSQKNVVDNDETREDIENEWRRRLELKIPPGYKDGSKSDTGIGDYLIWLTILKLGKSHKKDLIFVTSEEKPDWFVRADNEGIYPRPELVDEYRRISGGRKLHISKLAALLSDMAAPPEVVQEIREVEIAANTAANFSTTGNQGVVVESRHRSVRESSAWFDYSTQDGVFLISQDSSRFFLRFSKASDQSIHLYRHQETSHIARLKNVRSGQAVRFEDFDSTSRSYTLSLGDVFLVKNNDGLILAGRITQITDDSRGASRDGVAFSYSIFGPTEHVVVP